MDWSASVACEVEAGRDTWRESLKRRGQNREQCGLWDTLAETGGAWFPQSHCPVLGVVEEWACAFSTCELRVKL